MLALKRFAVIWIFLAELDLIRRHHGGAASPSSAENSDYVDRKQFFSSQKNNIAQEVAKVIP